MPLEQLTDKALARPTFWPFWPTFWPLPPKLALVREIREIKPEKFASRGQLFGLFEGGRGPYFCPKKFFFEIGKKFFYHTFFVSPPIFPILNFGAKNFLVLTLLFNKRCFFMREGDYETV